MKVEAIPFARKVLEYAQQEHDGYTFDMSVFWTTSMSGCHTSACLAGTAVLLDPEVQIINGWPRCRSKNNLREGIPERAMELMGLNIHEAVALFYTSNTEALTMLQKLIEEAEKKECSI